MSLNPDIARYFDRQIRLAEIGKTGQESLLQSSVLVIGAGGLGCPALQYLAAAGVGKLGIVDFDTVEETNLHRQLLYAHADLGLPKAIAAANFINDRFPHTQVHSYVAKLQNSLAAELFPQYQLILDCTDRPDTRYLISDACALMQKPWVYASVNGFSGQWALLNAPDISYRDIFPLPPLADSVVNCNTEGTVGVIPGFTGTMQALLAIKFLTGQKEKPQLHTFDALNQQFYSFEIIQNNHSAQPKNLQEFLDFNYPLYCNMVTENTISAADLVQLSESQNILIVDVREEDEMPVCRLKTTIHVPLKLVSVASFNVDAYTEIVVICQSGNRSKQAVEVLNTRYPNKKFLNLEGGMNELKKYIIPQVK